MVRTRKKLCSKHSNEAEERPRRRVKRRDSAEEEHFAQEVEQGRKLLAGILPEDQKNEQPPPVADDALPDQDRPDLFNEFMPIDDLPPIHVDEAQRDNDRPALGEVNDVIQAFVNQHREYRYAQDRERFRQQWEAIENQITAAYLQCETKTLNWTRKSSYLNNIGDVCHCPQTSFYFRKSASKAVRFCRCLPEPVQLVYQGYLPASPRQPRTAFSIPLVQLYHNVWETSVAAASSFIDGIMKFHNKRCCTPLLGRSA
ncbi:hypothetical protein DFH28DRAFT_1171847, partial [Melampsora americana]